MVHDQLVIFLFTLSTMNILCRAKISDPRNWVILRCHTFSLVKRICHSLYIKEQRSRNGRKCYVTMDKDQMNQLFSLRKFYVETGSSNIVTGETKSFFSFAKSVSKLAIYNSLHINSLSFYLRMSATFLRNEK